MNDVYNVFVTLRFVINETIDSNVYKVLQYMTEWPMIVGEKPVTYENDFFRNDDWPEFFARNGVVALGNFMAYEDMGIQKVFTINSYVPNNRKNTVFSFIKWLKDCIQFDRQEAVLGLIDNIDSCEVITNRRALPIDFKALVSQ